MIIQALSLSIKEDGVFRPERQEVELKLGNPRLDFTELVMCAKSCDGTFHPVNSDIVTTLTDFKHLMKTNVGYLINQLSPDEEVHGQRFVIFKPKKENKAYLLGDITQALKKLKEIF